MSNFKDTHQITLYHEIDCIQSLFAWRTIREHENQFILELEDNYGSLNTKEKAIIRNIINECRNITYKNMPLIVAKKLIEFIQNPQN